MNRDGEIMTTWHHFFRAHRHLLPEAIFLLLTIIPWLIFAALPYLASR